MSKDDINHLFVAIKEKYPLKIDWTGSKYIGIDLKWDYKKTRSKTINEGVRKASTTAIPTPDTIKTSLWTNQVRST